MKKLFSVLIVITLLAPINVTAFGKKSCFSMAREIVLLQDGEINLDNVGFVLELTAYLNTTGLCD